MSAAGAETVRGPERREPGWRINFLDPDGPELEAPTATLAERITAWW